MNPASVSINRDSSPKRMPSLLERLSALPGRLLGAREPRRLRICETLSLGPKGYLAVVRYGEERFLVGGTNSSIALLARLSHPLVVAEKDQKRPAVRDAALDSRWDETSSSGL